MRGFPEVSGFPENQESHLFDISFSSTLFFVSAPQRIRDLE